MTTETDQPARAVHLFEQVHEILWGKILDGEIRPSQRLKDSEWATRLGVSRTPVREAMRKMLQEGILLPLSNGGYEVRSVDIEDLEGLYRCRAALESLACRELAARADRDTVSRLRQTIEECDKTIANGEFDQAFKLNTRFHLEIIEHCGNEHLIGLCNAIHKLVLFYRASLLNEVRHGVADEARYVKRLREKQKWHRRILKAISAADSASAAALMDDHLREAARRMGEETSVIASAD